MKMSPNPSPTFDPMAVEANTESESAAAPQDPAPGPRQGSFLLLLTDEDLESPSSMEDASTPASRIQAEPSWISPRTEISEIVATGALGMRHSMQ